MRGRGEVRGAAGQCWRDEGQRGSAWNVAGNHLSLGTAPSEAQEEQGTVPRSRSQLVAKPDPGLHFLTPMPAGVWALILTTCTPSP